MGPQQALAAVRDSIRQASEAVRDFRDFLDSSMRMLRFVTQARPVASPVDAGVALAAQFPGLNGVMERGTSVLDSARDVFFGDLARAGQSYGRRMYGLMGEFPQAFAPVRTIEIPGSVVTIGSPMDLGTAAGGRPEDTAIPVYIQSGGRTQLVMAYMSESQACWRRFVGHAGGMGYVKGDNQHFQNFDWRIQQQLDEVALQVPHLSPSRGGHRLSLRDFGPAFEDIGPSLGAEDLVQRGMREGATTLRVWDSANRPLTLVGYWQADSTAYGRHINMVVRSENERYLYGIAATADGIFLQYVQETATGTLTRLGSPSTGVMIEAREEWMMTPIVEYRKEAAPLRKSPRMGSETRRKVEDRVTGTERPVISIVPADRGVRGDRALVTGLHDSPRSPFYLWSRFMRPVCEMLAQGDVGGAMEAMENRT